MYRKCLFFAMVMPLASPALADEQLVVNGGFETESTGWAPFWARSGRGFQRIVPDLEPRRGAVAEIEYGGKADWSFAQEKSVTVDAGEIYEMTAAVRWEGAGSAILGVILYDGHRRAISWSFGGRSIPASKQWQTVRTRFVIPAGGASITARLMGTGPIHAWFDNVSLVLNGTIADLRSPDLPKQLDIQNRHLGVTFDTQGGTLAITDRSGGRTFVYRALQNLLITKAAALGDQLQFQLLKPDDMLQINGSLTFVDDEPECVLALRARGELLSPLTFPASLVTEGGDFLVLPVNEGISYPVDDAGLEAMNYHLFGGHGLCMSFWGVVRDQGGLMGIVETPDDARINVPRMENRLTLEHQWIPQRGKFGVERRVRFIAIPDGGYVAMCKRYRRFVKQAGRLVTLTEKRRANPAVDQLIGAANIWCWDRDPVSLAQEMQDAGMERLLWSRRSEPAQIDAMNSMNVLTGRYDIFQDVMNPENYSRLPYRHPDWTSSAWPDKIIHQADGSWVKGWRVKGKDGGWYPCGVLCDRFDVDFARSRIPDDLATHSYRARFIDTATAAPWRECEDSRHPMTRSESRQLRMALLKFVSDDCAMVTGSETGHDAAVPFVHYFEGMMSLGPYRIEDAGRDMATPVLDVPSRVARFQTGHRYRLPLWELVYHDCVVAHWYWGDYNNKLPDLWDRRDLWNALYGTPPMFMCSRRSWHENRDRFVQSYKKATPVARETGYREMLFHKWLTTDHAVQQCRFAGGVTVTVNFGDSAYVAPDRSVIPAMSYRMVRSGRVERKGG